MTKTQEFDCIFDEKPILSDGIDGLRVVQV